ncbi:MAG TPA: 3-phosphoshikimate 1-carboxyvinyltransferase [Lacunisphaera sp.]|nr:3-phosphoshikimate 1-carboxyvinyltransferase [Lacunisphaera sp.]HQY04961.1 3-phosphoshikimate 1-carboxyvinyltransferase [Lacunisphaera sp.]
MSTYPDKLPIAPFTRPVRGSVTLPGSKSITNRALILAALARGTTTLHGALFSRDTQIMVAALRALGFVVVTDENALTITIAGRAGEIPVREAKLEVGNAGTAARFLTAFVCLRPDGTYHFDGDEAMRRRPIGALLEAIESQGARASGRNFPFTLRTAGLRGGEVALDASESSQMLSALLLVAPHAKSPLTVKLKGEAGSKPFVAMTEAMVRQFAAAPADYRIEGDASAASYFLALPVVTGGALTLPNYGGPLQGDMQFREVIAAVARDRRGRDQNFREFSDTFLTLAAIAPLLAGPTKISGIAHTRKQETDRVAGMARELTKLGQQVIETEDSLEIHPRPLVPGVEIETYHDHRFAMSFGILGCHDLLKNGRPWLTIKDPACCAKTFPAFFDLLAGLRAASH